jgi:hypothetical protein
LEIPKRSEKKRGAKMRKAYLKAVSVAGVLAMLLALVPVMTVSAAPVVDGVPDTGNYNLYGISPGGRGTLYYAMQGNTLYILMVVDYKVNDNVFGDMGVVADQNYVKTAGWKGSGAHHNFKALLNSDNINLTLTCGTDTWTWQQDYLYQSGSDWKSDHLGPDGLGTPPPGIVSHSSLEWNLEHTSWDITLGGNRTTNETWKSPDDVEWPPSDNDVTNNGWPGYDSGSNWYWSLAYEMSMNVPSCATNPPIIRVNSAHNSPAKDDDPDVPVYPKDCGDLPDPPYPTLTGSNGACHTIPDGPFPYMGNTIDADPNGQPSGLALGDDGFDGWDDEDGAVDVVGGMLDLEGGEIPQVRIVVSNPTGSTATLYGWIDFNGDGVLDNATERASISVPPGTDHATFILVFGQVLPEGDYTTFARFRISTDGVSANPTGLATNGEVEDYVVNVEPMLVTVSSFGAFEDAGRAVVFWGTSSQMDTAGFTLLRLNGATGEYAQIGPSVPAMFGSDGGMYYTVDETARPGGVYTYKLVEVEFGGAQNEYGPFTVKVYRSQGY